MRTPWSLFMFFNFLAAIGCAADEQAAAPVGTTRMASSTGSLTTPRSGHTATLLTDGRVLVVGGGTATAEVYDLVTGTWTRLPEMTTSRTNHSATLLRSGRVLVTGGEAGGSSLAWTEILTLTATGGTWAAGPPLIEARDSHTATLLQDGRVLIAGGARGSAARLASCEIYDPSAGTIRPTGSLAAARARHTATLLRDGRVLV